jgi:hypothetical protein
MTIILSITARIGGKTPKAVVAVIAVIFHPRSRAYAFRDFWGRYG